MANPLEINQRTWRDWTYCEWNAVLFDYFFRVREGDTTPLSRIVVTGEELQRVTADDEAKPSEVFEAFRTVILDRLQFANRTLCNDARNLEWRKQRKSTAIPQYFGHLVVTCIAASGTASAKRPKGEFRKRLNEFLRRGEDNPSYALGALPQLWEMLSKWLERAAREGEPYRTLVLSRPEHLKIIGYSLELAFPPHKDQRELEEILANIPVPAPVVPVLERIETHLHRFGPRFRQTYHEFRAAYFGDKEGLYRWPFWSAVLDALKSHSHGTTATRSASQPRLVLRLDTDAEWRFSLTIYTDVAIVHLKHLRSVPADEFSLEGYHFLLTGSEAEDCSPPSLLLKEQLPASLRSTATADLRRTVSEGVLLFQMNEEGVWLLALSRPQVGPLRALIRTDLIDPFFVALLEIGANPRRSESLYASWHEVDGFDARHLGEADFAAADFGSVRCLADIISVPRISIRDGVRLGSNWLGRRQSLPKFMCEIESAKLSIRPRHSPEAETVALKPTHGERTEYAIPTEFLDGQDLNGEFLIGCTVEGRNEANRVVEFTSNVLTHDYPFPASPEAWFGEGGLAPTEDLISAEELPSEVTTVIEGFSLTHLSNRFSVTPSAADETNDAVVDTLAAMSLRHRGISESDVYSAFRRILGLNGSAIWDVIRAWVEAGVLDLLTFRRWRKRSFFARRPRLVFFSKSGGQVAATLIGLVPSGLRARLEEEAPKSNVRVIRHPPQGPLVPCLFVLEARSIKEHLMFSESLGLAAPRALLPIEQVVSSVEAASKCTTPPVQNHHLAGTWNWEKQWFVTGNYQADVSVDWYKREDTPDAFVVRVGEKEIFSTRSRTWAFLVATTRRGEKLFASRGQGVLGRTYPHHFHLPVALGRWCAIATGISPAPVLGRVGTTDYLYPFPGLKEQNAAIATLWPSYASRKIDARTRWLLLLARSQGQSTGSPEGSTKLVPLPNSMRRVIAESSEDSLSAFRMIPAWLLPRLHALTTPLKPLEVSRKAET